jgi:hypothetical protein
VQGGDCNIIKDERYRRRKLQREINVWQQRKRTNAD